VAKQDGALSVVLDGRAGAGYSGILERSLTFSPDGTHIAYGARNANRWTVVLDRDSGTFYDDVNGPHFSPNSAHLAYAAARDGKYFVVLDSEEGPAYDKIIENGPSFRSDFSLEWLAIKDNSLYRVKCAKRP
jgi:hypothetical protein